MIFNIVNGLPKNRMPPVFQCTGTSGTDYVYNEETPGADGTINWSLTIKNTCSISFSRVVPVDVFLVGGGGGGATGYAGHVIGDYYRGGGGGGGGYRRIEEAVSLSEGSIYTVTIGAGGGSGSDGGASSAFGYSANGGKAGNSGDNPTGGAGGANGGDGAYWASNEQYNPSAGTDGGYAFGESSWDGIKYGPGGGGGGVYGHISSANGGVTIGAPGGGGVGSDAADYGGGSGAPGIIIIRNTRRDST